MNQLESLDKSKALVRKEESRMDRLLDEGITHASEVIDKIRKADRLAVIYRFSSESVFIGVMDNGSFDSVSLKSLLSLVNREIEYNGIFVEDRGETPFKPGGQQRISNLFGKPVEFMQRFGGMDSNYLNTETWKVFEPQV